MITQKNITLRDEVWNYYESKTFNGRSTGGETLTNTTLIRQMDYRFNGSDKTVKARFEIVNFDRDISWDEGTEFVQYTIGKKSLYRSRAKAVAAIRRHFLSEEWSTTTPDYPNAIAFGIYPDCDKDGQHKTPGRYCVAVKW